MTARDLKAREIAAAFQSYVKTGDDSSIDSYSIQELRHADEAIGNRDINDSYRLSLRNRIKVLDDLHEKKQNSHIRTVGYLMAFALGVLSTVVAYWLLKLA